MSHHRNNTKHSVDNRTRIEYCESGKPCYDKKTAVTAKNKRWHDDHIELRVYHCNQCNYHHLTHNI